MRGTFHLQLLQQFLFLSVPNVFSLSQRVKRELYLTYRKHQDNVLRHSFACSSALLNHCLVVDFFSFKIARFSPVTIQGRSPILKRFFLQLNQNY